MLRKSMTGVAAALLAMTLSACSEWGPHETVASPSDDPALAATIRPPLLQTIGTPNLVDQPTFACSQGLQFTGPLDLAITAGQDVDLNQVAIRLVDGMVTLEQLQAHDSPLSLLAPVDALLSSFPRIDLTLALAARFLNGQRLALNREPVTLPDAQGRVRVYHDDKLLGTAILQEYGVLAPERLVSVARPA